MASRVHTENPDTRLSGTSPSITWRPQEVWAENHAIREQFQLKASRSPEKWETFCCRIGVHSPLSSRGRDGWRGGRQCRCSWAELGGGGSKSTGWVRAGLTHRGQVPNSAHSSNAHGLPKEASNQFLILDGFTAFY